jgi:glycosyltransferase involved in cell wall biosynthesis
MKVLMLNTFDEWGGAARAALRLHRGVRAAGIDSRLMVQFKTGDAEDVLCDRRPLVKLARQAKMLLDRLPVLFHPNKPVYNFTPAMLPQGMTGRVDVLDPDILHLHWLAAGYLRIETLKRFRKPLVWTLHDSWAFTGGCHVPFECVRYRERCGACPVLGSSRERDLSRRVWERKAKAWRNLRLTVVAPSRWLAGCAKSSALFAGVRVEAIPNGLDPALFKPADKRLARDRLRLPQGKKFVLFGAMGGTGDRNKGFHLLLSALQKMSAGGWKDTAELLVIGASEPASPPPFGMRARFLGRLQDDASLALAYAAADVFVSPSMLENLSNSVMEAMACGTPCVAFRQGGMPELIENGRTGYLAQPYEPGDLAAGIGGMLGNDAARREMGRCSRRKAEEEFALDRISKRYVDLYREILA